MTDEEKKNNLAELIHSHNFFYLEIDDPMEYCKGHNNYMKILRLAETMDVRDVEAIWNGEVDLRVGDKERKKLYW